MPRVRDRVQGQLHQVDFRVFVACQLPEGLAERLLVARADLCLQLLVMLQHLLFDMLLCGEGGADEDERVVVLLVAELSEDPLQEAPRALGHLREGTAVFLAVELALKVAACLVFVLAPVQLQGALRFLVCLFDLVQFQRDVLLVRVINAEAGTPQAFTGGGKKVLRLEVSRETGCGRPSRKPQSALVAPCTSRHIGVHPSPSWHVPDQTRDGCWPGTWSRGPADPAASPE